MNFLNLNALQSVLNLAGIVVTALATDTSWTAILPPDIAVKVVGGILVLKTVLNSVNQGMTGQFKPTPKP